MGEGNLKLKISIIVREEIKKGVGSEILQLKSTHPSFPYAWLSLIFSLLFFSVSGNLFLPFALSLVYILPQVQKLELFFKKFRLMPRMRTSYRRKKNQAYIFKLEAKSSQPFGPVSMPEFIIAL